MRKLRVDLRSGNSSDLNSACLKVLVPVEIFQFSDMHYETERYRDSTDGLNGAKLFEVTNPASATTGCIKKSLQLENSR